VFHVFAFLVPSKGDLMRLLFMMMLSGLLLGAGPTTAPVEKRTLWNGQIEYVPPAEWTYSEKQSSNEKAVWVSEDRHGAMLLTIQPEGMVPSDTLAVAILKKIKEEHEKPGIKVTKPARIEKKKDFEIYIPIEYEQGENKYVKTFIYRHRGKRTLSLTVTALNAENEEQKKSIVTAGEQMLISCKWTKK
jgi:hypothetical protein